jgi:hypothetical protein
VDPETAFPSLIVLKKLNLFYVYFLGIETDSLNCSRGGTDIKQSTENGVGLNVQCFGSANQIL